MLIRPARLEDARQLAEVHVGSWQTAYRGIVPDSILNDLSVEAWTERWQQRLSIENEAHTLVLAFEESVIGWTTVGPARDPDCSVEDTQEVYGIYLRAEYWEHGHGTQLYAASEDQMRKSGAADAVLWVLRDNSRARRFYERQGYLIDRIQPERQQKLLQLAELRYRKQLV
jgi:ribosomal protein S18 acetylase RimI-like enzyme